MTRQFSGTERIIEDDRSAILLAGGAVVGFGALLGFSGDVMWTALVVALLVGLVVELWLAVAPSGIRGTSRALVLFGSGAVMLWTVFELRPSLVVYASVSVGVILGLAGGRVGKRVYR